jgi:stage II sporulation protein M
LITLVNGVVIGYLAGFFLGVHRFGFFVCGVAPHGFIEIPALVLSSAFALRVGASMVRPAAEGWLAGMRSAVADYGRGMLVVIPMFAVAAVIEAYVTPGLLSKC